MGKTVDRFSAWRRRSKGHNRDIVAQKALVWSAIVLCGATMVVAGGSRVAAAQVEPSIQVPDCKGCNVVFVVFDTLRADYDQLFDRSKTLMPAVERVASHALVFTQAVSASSWTLPAIMSLFTGVYPSRHGMTNKYPPQAGGLAEWGEVLHLKEQAPDLVTLAEEFRRGGYRTAAFTGGAGMHHEFGFDAGFDVYEDARPFAGLHDTVPKALAWIREHRDEPFFVFLHGYDCHGQYEPPNGWDYRYVPEGYSGVFTGTKDEQRELRQEGLKAQTLYLTDRDVAFWRGIYAERVERADAQFGTFLEAFKRIGVTGRTILVVTSDHGEELMEHGRLDHGPTLYEEIVRVPLVIAVPGMEQSIRIERQARSVDVMPTLLALTGLEASVEAMVQMQGTDLLAGGAVNRDALMETEYRYYTALKALRITELPGWKLIVNRGTGTRQLFNLSRDPHEQDDVHVGAADEADRLMARLQYGSTVERRRTYGLPPES